jgi:predicted ribosome quality control (RQC) complex YloA/Tae2 family protein
MVKTRFSAADVRAVVRDLRGRVLGMRVVNVYDIDAKTYLVKLAEPGKAEKVILLLESGIRFHSTRFDRDKADMPSGFSMKLRKHIRSKRLEDISQLGIDRVVDFRCDLTSSNSTRQAFLFTSLFSFVLFS